MKTTYKYFTRKQAGVIYSAVKRGLLDMDKEQLSYMYNEVVGVSSLGEFCGFGEDIEGNIFYHVRATLKAIVDAIFNNDYEKAQALAYDGLSGEGFWYSGGHF